MTFLLLLLGSGCALSQVNDRAAKASGSGLPSLGDNLELSAASERRLGDRIASSIYRDPDYIDDPVLGDYVQAIWSRLLTAARARGELNAELDERFSWEIFLIRDRSINAFALPGGYMGVHLGLIGAVENRDELAAVLGHELSHITQRHISRLMTQQSRTTPLMIGAMILGMLAASKSPNAAQAAMMGGQAVAAQTQLNFSRDMEREADRVGYGVMTDAGFDSRGVGSMFEKLQQASRINDNGSFPYLRSHPMTTQRIAEARARLQLTRQDSSASPMAAAEAADAALLHALMSARARVLADPGTEALQALVAEAQRRPAAARPALNPMSAADMRTAGAWYAGALAAAKSRNFVIAGKLNEKLGPLTEGHAEAAEAAALLSVEIATLAGVAPPDAAQLDLTQVRSRAALLTRSGALLSGGRAAEAADGLRTWVTGHPGDAAAWQQLGTAYGMLNQNVRAIRADAEARAAQLQYTAALDRFKAAQALIRSNPASADFMEGSIIDTRTRQVESLVREQALQEKLDR